MGTRIFKYEIYNDGNLTLPKGAKILSVAAVGNEIFLWAEVNPSEIIMNDRAIVVFGTGWPIPNLKKKVFIGTVIMQNGMVFHVFEALNTALEE